MNKFIIGVFLASIGCTYSHASIIGFVGNADLLVAGPGVGYTANFFQDLAPTKVHGWNESQNFTLNSNLIVDINAPGAYNGSANANAVISAGTVVNSHYLYYDPKNADGAQATFKFSGPILGIIVRENTSAATDHLMASDFLIPAAVPLVNRSLTHFTARGLEASDNVQWIGTDTVRVSWDASNPGDQIRVITAVPEPSSFVALCGAAVLAVIRRRKSK